MRPPRETFGGDAEPITPASAAYSLPHGNSTLWFEATRVANAGAQLRYGTFQRTVEGVDLHINHEMARVGL